MYVQNTRQAGYTHCTADQADEEEMHWSPVTGLPQPLSAAACKGAGVRADRSAHLLEKQVWCHSALHKLHKSARDWVTDARLSEALLMAKQPC